VGLKQNFLGVKRLGVKNSREPILLRGGFMPLFFFKFKFLAFCL